MSLQSTLPPQAAHSAPLVCFTNDGVDITPVESAGLNRPLSAREWAKQFNDLANQLTGVGRQAMDDPNHAFRLNEMGCFVAGTLVHTSEGLKPIEQIKVGDLVLSRPETGEGETSYQPVTRVFEYEDREVYWLPITEVDENLRYHKGNKYEGVAVTGAHPIWIDHYRQKSWEGEDVITTVNAWVNVEEYYLKALRIRDKAEHDNRLSEPKAYGRMTNGRLVRVGVPIPILKGKAPDEGVWFFDYPDWDGEGAAVHFDSRGVSLTGKDVGLGWNAADANYDYTGYDTTSPMSVVVRSKGHLPIRRTVYNLEVANNHSYFVGELGLWVHNTSGVEIRLPLKPA